MATDTVPVRIHREVLQAAKLNAVLARKPLQDWLSEAVEQRIRLENHPSLKIEATYTHRPFDEVVARVMDDYVPHEAVVSSALRLIEAVKERDEAISYKVTGDDEYIKGFQFIRELIERDPWKIGDYIAMLEAEINVLKANHAKPYPVPRPGRSNSATP